MKLCFLVSGNGGNLKFFHLGLKVGILNNIDLTVISDRDCQALDYAKKVNIPNFKISYLKEDNRELIGLINELEPDMIITTWHKIIDSELINLYNGKLINLHYSLLPSFKGLIGITPIKKALEMNCKYIGVTCHYVNEKVDSGQIISQSILKVDNDSDFGDIVEYIFRKGCLILLNSILIVTNDFSIIEKKETKDFTFSPNLKFDIKMFNKQFWERLKKL